MQLFAVLLTWNYRSTVANAAVYTVHNNNKTGAVTKSVVSEMYSAEGPIVFWSKYFWKMLRFSDFVWHFLIGTTFIFNKDNRLAAPFISTDPLRSMTHAALFHQWCSGRSSGAQVVTAIVHCKCMELIYEAVVRSWKSKPSLRVFILQRW